VCDNLEARISECAGHASAVRHVPPVLRPPFPAPSLCMPTECYPFALYQTPRTAQHQHAPPCAFTPHPATTPFHRARPVLGPGNDRRVFPRLWLPRWRSHRGCTQSVRRRTGRAWKHILSRITEPSNEQGRTPPTLPLMICFQQRGVWSIPLAAGQRWHRARRVCQQ